MQYVYPMVTLSQFDMINNGYATADKVKTHIDAAEIEVIYLGMSFFTTSQKIWSGLLVPLHIMRGGNKFF